MGVRSIGLPASLPGPLWDGTAAAPTSLVPNLYQCAIAGHPYVLEMSKYDRQTVPLQRQATDESVEPGEQSMNIQGAWRRSQDNWFMGAGQGFGDNRFAFVSVYTHSGEDPSIRTRFWRSKGVNPWVEGELTLLPAYANKGSSSGTGQLIEVVGPDVFWWDGTNLKVSTNPNNATPTWTTVTPPAGSGSWPTVTAMSTDGTKVYLALGTSGVCTCAAGSTTAAYLRPTISAPTVVAEGTPGSTTYHYAVVAVDAAGFKSLPSALTTITNGAASLTSSNFNLITWTAVPGTDHYEILKADTGHLLTTVTGTSYSDNGTVVTTTAYTAATATTLNLQADFVLYANGFLVASVGPQLCEVISNGAASTLMTHINSGWKWTAGCPGPVAMYVAGVANNVSELYGIQSNTTTFDLGVPFIAGQVPFGETINSLAYYQGLVVIATSNGIRVAQDTQSNGHLTNGPVITDTGAVHCASPFGSFIWYGISGYADSDGIWTGSNATTSGLGRLSLQEFSNPLLPAYATDVMTPANSTNTVTSVGAWTDGNQYFCVDKEGVYGPDGTNLVPQGFMETGWWRYGTIEPKTLVATSVRHDPLPAGAAVILDVVPFGSAMNTVLVSRTTGSTGPPESVSAGQQVGEAFEVVPILQRGTDPTTGPVVHRWTARSLVSGVRQDQIVVPIVWRPLVQSMTPGMEPLVQGGPSSQGLVAEWLFLKGLEATQQTFLYQEGELSYTCFIDQIEFPQDPANKWADDHSIFTGNVLLVKLLTVA